MAASIKLKNANSFELKNKSTPDRSILLTPDQPEQKFDSRYMQGYLDILAQAALEDRVEIEGWDWKKYVANRMNKSDSKDGQPVDMLNQSEIRVTLGRQRLFWQSNLNPDIRLNAIASNGTQNLLVVKNTDNYIFNGKDGYERGIWNEVLRACYSNQLKQIENENEVVESNMKYVPYLPAKYNSIANDNLKIRNENKLLEAINKIESQKAGIILAMIDYESTSELPRPNIIAALNGKIKSFGLSENDIIVRSKNIPKNEFNYYR